MPDPKSNTVTITQEMIDERPLVIGERRELGDMPEDEARAVFGDAFYEAWMAARNLPVRHGTVTVTAIDREAGTITVRQPRAPGRRPR